MKFSSLAVCLFSVALSLVSAQQTVQSGASTNAVISQYGSTFKNAGGSVLHDKVNGKKKKASAPYSFHKPLTITVAASVHYLLRQLVFDRSSARTNCIYEFH